MAIKTIKINLVSETCCNCGVVFGLESKHRKMLLDSGNKFCCPNGHMQYYTESTRMKLERELEWQKKKAERWERRAQAAKGSLIATKGHMTRLKNRIAEGLCPYCNKGFADLEEHMRNSHPPVEHDKGVNQDE